MNPERFRQIEDLYHAVREGTPEERGALLAQTDPELRREIELLLIQSDRDEFLDRPAIQNAPELLSDSSDSGFSAGTILGPYRIEDQLGKGGMGEVFRAIDTRLGRAVAIKTAHQQFSARFEREARAISSLNHPNICTLYDIGPNYLVMELLEGVTIAERLKNGPLPLKTSLLYGSQIAAALVEAHAKGIVHRDLKPGNIMIAKSGVKVLDFGLAKSGQDDTVTDSCVVMGTRAYMPPEQIEGKPADARTDIYSFGCVLYEMLTGARVGSLRKRIPQRKLERIISRCLEEEPGRRFQSATELERELAGVAGTGSAGKRTLAASTVILGVFIATYFYLQRTSSLTGTDTLVLANFVNNTGDPVFDGTLRQGLAIQLEQSPFLKIMDDGRVQSVLRLMSLPRGAGITNQVAREICIREAATATIDGTIASLGKSYVITLQALTCPDGATLAREQIQAIDKEHILNAVGSAATAIRGKLGEPHSSIQKRNRPLEQATTLSLEALQNYTMAVAQMKQGKFSATVPSFQRAIQIDPNFAMAYFYLGVAYEQAGDVARSAEYGKQAFRLVDRVSEYERALITPYYYRATGESDKEVDAYALGARTYSREWGFHNQLSLALIDRGQYEEGLKEGLEAVRLQPNIEPPYRRVLDAYICLDRLPEARQLARKVRTLRLDGGRIHQRFLEMAYIEDDEAGIAKEIQWFAGKPEEYLSFGLQAANWNVHGRRRESHKLYQRAAEKALLKDDLRDAASEFEEADALADALSGNCLGARRAGRPALALAICGDSERAEVLAAATSQKFPSGTIWNSVQLPAIRAAIALNRDKPATSVDLLASASPFERSYLGASYLRGLAYLRLRQSVEAAAEFRKILDHRGASWGATWVHPYWGQFYALSLLGSARAFALAGDTSKSKQAFQRFFALWKAADSDVPILLQAKAEYAALR